MRLLLLGGTGQVGEEFRALAVPTGVEVIAPSRAALDLQDPLAIARMIAAVVRCEWDSKCVMACIERSCAALALAGKPHSFGAATDCGRAGTQPKAGSASKAVRVRSVALTR
jgi:dTDP-6-deoxy-L-lyxo-4-hexulose reductase RmlD-like protein